MNEIRMIPIGQLDHHPMNPRTDLGDLSELAESIRSRGIMQNLTVVPDLDSGKYLVVIGNRRLEASRIAGLAELPCHISMMDEKEQMATMLMENMQRQDLTVYEQAQGFQMMMDLGFTASEIGEKTGFSERTVNNRIKLTKYRKRDFEAACNRGATLMDFAELEKIEKAEDRYEVMRAAGTPDFRQKLKGKIREQEFEKNQKRVKALMKELDIREIPKNETYSNKYESFLDIDLGLPDKKITDQLEKKLDPQTEYVYEISRYYGDNGMLRIRRVLKKPGGLSQAEKDHRAMVRKMNDHLRKVKSFYKEAYELRCQFVKEYTPANGGGGIANVAERSLRAALRQKNHWDDRLQIEHRWNDHYIRRIFDLPERPEKNEDLFELVGAKGNLAKIMLAFTLGGGVLSDSPDVGWYDRSDGRWKEKDNWYTPEAEAIYGFLEECGYQMSEMEKQLRDGTHPCYQMEEAGKC